MMNRLRFLLKNQTASIIVLAVAGFVGAVVLSTSLAFRTLELKTYDMRFNLRGPVNVLADSIVIVAQDDQSFSSIPERYPYARSLYAHALRNLAEAGARLIVMDIEFTEPDSRHPGDDSLLAAAARAAGNVIFAGKIVTEFGKRGFENSYVLQPLDVLTRSAAGWALVNITEDVDGFIRRYIISHERQGKSYHPLAVAAYQKLVPRGEEFQMSDGLFRLGTLEIPRYGNTMLINFRGPAGTFPTFSFSSVIDDYTYSLGANEDTDIFELHKEWGTFRNKIVFIGATAEELQDNKFTPFFDFNGSKKKLPGVELHANALSTLLHGDFITILDQRIKLLMMLLLAVLVVLLGRQMRPLVGGALVLLLAVVLIAGAVLAFSRLNLWIEIIDPLSAIFLAYVGSVVHRVVIERQEKGRVKRVFQQYVAKSVVDNMLSSGEMPRFGGERRELTVLFSDIRSFTSYCERHAPESVVYTLNEYLTAMVDIIFRHQGTLDKFVGDEIMALYGAPLHFPNHAIRACETAYEMIMNLRELQEKWSRDAQDFFQIGIGINTGKMIVGNLGSQQLFDYTVIGDEVNLAARLEGANKQYWTTIIISESTYVQAKSRILARELDLVRVKGKNKPVKIFELRGLDQLPAIEQDLVIEVYQKGLAHYKEQRWYEAIKEFKRVLRYFPSDGPSRVYIKRCLDFIESPPPENWDGVFEFKSK